MKKYLLRTFLPLITLLLILLFLSARDDNKENAFKRTRLLMGTLVEITLYDDGSGRKVEEAMTLAFDEIKRLEALLGRRQEGSDIWNVNDAPGKAVPVSPETLDVVEAGRHFHQISRGHFDMALGNLVDLWRFDGEEDKKSPPADEKILALLKRDGAEIITLDRTAATLSAGKGASLDLGGIAKGYIIDRAGETFLQRGIKNFIINGGGDMMISGKKGERPWRIGLQHPRRPGEVLAHIDIAEGPASIVTSGDYERFFLHEGTRYHHILNPFTGYPARGLMSVTIQAGDTLTADALSTAVFVMGREAGMALIESLEGVEGVLVDDDLKVHISSGLIDRVTLR